MSKPNRKRRPRTPEQHRFELALEVAHRALRKWAAWSSGSAAIDNTYATRPYSCSLTDLVMNRRGDEGYRPTFTHPIRQPISLGITDDIARYLSAGVALNVEGYAVQYDEASGQLWAIRAEPAAPEPSDRRTDEEMEQHLSAVYRAGSHDPKARTQFRFTGTGPEVSLWLTGDQLKAIDEGAVIHDGQLQIWRSKKGYALLARRIRSITARGKQSRSHGIPEPRPPQEVLVIDRVFRDAPDHIKTLLHLHYLDTRLTGSECAEKAGYKGKTEYYNHLKAAKAYVLAKLEATAA